jgi:hypothetical protein
MATDRNARWVQYQAPPGSPFARLVYCSSVRGLSSAQSDQSLFYSGWIMPMPAPDVGESERAYADEWAQLVAALPPDTHPLAGGVAERYAFWDVVSGALTACWRVPTITASAHAEAPLPAAPAAQSMVAWSDRQGVSQETTGRPLIYWGRISRVPRAVMMQRIPGGMQPYEVDPAMLAQAAHQHGVQVVHGDLERYELWEVPTNDLLIVWRMPCDAL